MTSAALAMSSASRILLLFSPFKTSLSFRKIPKLPSSITTASCCSYSTQLQSQFQTSRHRDVVEILQQRGLLEYLTSSTLETLLSDLLVRERIFLLLDATQTSLGGATGKFPKYYEAYYELVRVGVQFPQRPHAVQSSNPTLQANKKDLPNGELPSSWNEEVTRQGEQQIVPESSIIQKASNALEVLKEVLDAVVTQHTEAEELMKYFWEKNVPAKVYVGMRYWHPFTEEAIDQVLGGL